MIFFIKTTSPKMPEVERPCAKADQVVRAQQELVLSFDYKKVYRMPGGLTSKTFDHSFPLIVAFH
jgi:hypothetical protein